MKVIGSPFWQLMKRSLAVGLCILPLVVPGCGGGTTGTGAGVQLSGTLRSTQGAPIPGVTVTASAVTPVRSERRDSSTAVTNGQGAFTVSVELNENEVPNLSFTGPGINSNFVVATVPPGTSIINIDLEYNEDTDEINEDSVNYEDENGHEIED